MDLQGLLLDNKAAPLQALLELALGEQPSGDAHTAQAVRAAAQDGLLPIAQSKKLLSRQSQRIASRLRFIAAHGTAACMRERCCATHCDCRRESAVALPKRMFRCGRSASEATVRATVQCAAAAHG